MVARTSDDLRSSAALLDSIRRRAGAIASDSEASTAELRRSFEELRATGTLFDRIADGSVVASERVDAIATAAEQQRARLGEIAAAMRRFQSDARELAEATTTLDDGVERIGTAHRELRETLAA